MKKRVWSLFLFMLLLTVLLTGCSCNHEWEEATCTEPKTCTLCSETEGEPLGHIWKEATCTEAKTCEVCGETEGKALGHTWKEATCTLAKECSVCGKIEGSELGHDPEGVTCTEAGTCKRCGKSIPAAGHKWKEATCTEPKTCSVCGTVEGEALGHTTKAGTCYRCGLELFEPISNSGSGNKVVSDIQLGSGIYTVHFKHTGRRNFIVHSYDKDGNKGYLVNTIGNYDGTVLLTGDSPIMLNIDADGSWSYTIDKLSTTAETSFSGTGDTITPIFSSSEKIWTFHHTGSRNFIVWLYTSDGRDLIVNDIGDYSGEQVVQIPAGSAAFFEITADGNWSISPSS